MTGTPGFAVDALKAGDRVKHKATGRPGCLYPETFWGTNYVGIAIRFDDSPNHEITIKGLHRFDVSEQYEIEPAAEQRGEGTES